MYEKKTSCVDFHIQTICFFFFFPFPIIIIDSNVVFVRDSHARNHPTIVVILLLLLHRLTQVCAVVTVLYI